MADIELKPIGNSRPKAPNLPPRHPHAAAAAATSSTGPSLGAAYRQAEEKAKAAVHLQEGGLDSISIWGLVASSWFAILGIPLLLFPRILLFFAQTPPAAIAAQAAGLDRDHYDVLTPLEGFLCLSLSLGLFSMALISLFVIVPSYTPPTTNPSRWPALAVLVGLSSVISLVAWNSPIGGLGTMLALGNTLVAVWGWWVVAFGQGKGYMAKTKSKSKNERWKKL